MKTRDERITGLGAEVDAARASIEKLQHELGAEAARAKDLEEQVKHEREAHEGSIAEA